MKLSEIQELHEKYQHIPDPVTQLLLEIAVLVEAANSAGHYPVGLQEEVDELLIKLEKEVNIEVNMKYRET